MAKIGMGKPGKEVESALKQAIEENLPSEDVLRRLTANFVARWLDALKEGALKFQDNFISEIMSAGGGSNEGFSSCLLPEGTRFVRHASRSVILVIEQKPTVRTLRFSHSNVNPDKEKTNFRLALPYIVFVPVFTYYDRDGSDKNVPYFSAMCVAYRNAPLTSMSDMLLHTNLPNLTHSGVTNPEYKPEGNIGQWQELIACNGFMSDTKSVAFELAPSDINTMTGQLMQHFWSSEFTDELAIYFNVMSKRDARLKNLKTWEKCSQEDPLFPIKVDWHPACRLNRLLDDVASHHDAKEQRTQQFTSKYVARVTGDAWNKVLTSSEATRAELAGYVERQLKDTFDKFAQSAARGLLVINNETIRKTVAFAVAAAIRDAMK